MRLFVSCSVALMFGGCGPAVRTSVQLSPPARVVAPEQIQPPPKVLSAHHADVDAPEYGGLDVITVVFSDEVDAASLRADAFLVVLADGRRTLATDATLAPASEADENRTVWLVGEFGDPSTSAPTDIVVIRPLHTERGASLQGTLGSVSGFSEGGRLVLAQAHPVPCFAGSARVRTYWTDALRDVSDDDLQAVDLELPDGRVVKPSAFADHHDAGDQVGEVRDDNVLDLCVPDGARVSAVRVGAGAFKDAAGHLNVATRASVSRVSDPR